MLARYIGLHCVSRNGPILHFQITSKYGPISIIFGTENIQIISTGTIYNEHVDNSNRMLAIIMSVLHIVVARPFAVSTMTTPLTIICDISIVICCNSNKLTYLLICSVLTSESEASVPLSVPRSQRALTLYPATDCAAATDRYIRCQRSLAVEF